MQRIYSSNDTKTKYLNYYREIEVLEIVRKEIQKELVVIKSELSKISAKTNKKFEFSLTLDSKKNFLSFCYINNLNIDYNINMIAPNILEKIKVSSEKMYNLLNNIRNDYLFPNMILSQNRSNITSVRELITFLSFTFIVPENYYICTECGDYVYDFAGINGSYELFCTYCLSNNDKKIIFTENLAQNENFALQTPI